MNFDKYIGIPWMLGGSDINRGVDCWGLCRHVLAEHFGVEMNLLQGVAVPIDDRVAHFEAVSTYNDWLMIDGPIMPADVVFFHGIKTGKPQHIGLCLGKNLVLHSMEQGGRGSQIQRLGLLKPYFEKLVFYRNKNATHYNPA